MEKHLTMTRAELHDLLREVADADDPGAPLRRLHISMGSLTDPCDGDSTDRLAAWNPYARYLQGLLQVEYANPDALFHALHNFLALLSDISGEHGSVLTYLNPMSVRRLLIGILLAVRLDERKPGEVSVRSYSALM